MPPFNIGAACRIASERVSWRYGGAQLILWSQSLNSRRPSGDLFKIAHTQL
jgi:hypothetical protein